MAGYDLHVEQGSSPGVDFFALPGTRVDAVVPGTVVFVGVGGDCNTASAHIAGGKNGILYTYTDITDLSVRVGQPVGWGQRVGALVSIEQDACLAEHHSSPHVHIGVIDQANGRLLRPELFFIHP
jgi:murein DD-endopeptidase MepM/ murein hydrolase activator NlpD